MSSLLRGIWDNTYGLLVDDGQLAIGALAAVAIAWIAAAALPAARGFVGWLLLAMVVVLLLANLSRAGANARRCSS